MKNEVRQTENKTNKNNAFERIFFALSAHSGFFSAFPSSMEARGAPPFPAKALKALIKVIIGRQIPNPVSGNEEFPGICPM